MNQENDAMTFFWATTDFFVEDYQEARFEPAGDVWCGGKDP